MVVVDVDDPKMAAFGRVGRQSGDGDVGAGVLVLLEHAAVIYFVYGVAGEDEHVFGLLGADGIDVLIDRVGRPHIPVLADPLHGGQDFDKLADLTAKNIPAFADLTIQREGLVLSEDIDAPQARVDTVRKRDVDDAVDAAEGYGWFGAVAGERIEALACASSGQKFERIFYLANCIGTPYGRNVQLGRCPGSTRNTSIRRDLTDG